MTEQEFDKVLCMHEHWLDDGAHIFDDQKKLRLEYEVIRGTWEDRDFKYASAVRCIFRNVIFRHCNFKDWRAADCSFFGCVFEECSFENSYMQNNVLDCCDFTKCNFDSCDFTSSMIRHCEFRVSVLNNCRFERSDIISTSFVTAEFKNELHFVNANIQNSYLPKGYERILGVVLKEPIIGYKKTRENVVIKAEIPAGAIVFSINGKKCRTNRAKIVDMNGWRVLHSSFDISFRYELGQEIEILDFDPCYSHDCAPGFHFFMTEEEAKEYRV